MSQTSIRLLNAYLAIDEIVKAEEDRRSAVSEIMKADTERSMRLSPTLKALLLEHETMSSQLSASMAAVVADSAANKAERQGKSRAPANQMTVIDPIRILIVLINTSNSGNSEIP